VLAIVGVQDPARAQVPALKGMPGEPAMCASTALVVGTPVVRLDASARAAVDSLIAAGSQAAILGEYDAATEYLRRAAALDPVSSVVAYRLARSLDDQGQAAAAIAEYCRYLSLSPAERDAMAVRERVRALAATGEVEQPDPWVTAMEQGADAYSAGRFRDAVQAFTRAIELRPEAAETYFNRAAAYQADSRHSIALHDLETYLTLAPDANDRSEVLGRIESLRLLAGMPAEDAPSRPGVVSPEVVLAQGLVLPGLGQHATGRTGLGALVLAAAGGAIYYGTRQEVVVRREGAYDPFGNYYEYDVRSVDRPRQALGIGAAIAIGVAGAIESYLYAKREEERSRIAVSEASVSLVSLQNCSRLESDVNDGKVLYPSLSRSTECGSRRRLDDASLCEHGPLAPVPLRPCPVGLARRAQTR
jgi:tetratricopeptide (TPR) repeat protein